MICSTCGGLVQWQGPLTNLTHTMCLKCGAINNQSVEEEPQIHERLGHQIEQRRETAMKLPEYAEACDAVETEYGTPLDRFIVDNEPAGEDDKEWRAQLKDALDWAAINWNPSAPK